MKFVRVLYFMLRKGISKSKMLFDLNRMMKRGKIASKSLHNLMFHNHHNNNNWATNFTTNVSPQPGEYEFSCSNSPSTNKNTFSLFHKKHHSNNRKTNDLDMMAVNAAVLKAMEMIHSENASPALPGFGRSPMVRQLRVTDSPFPLSSMDEDSHVVDEAAEQFINRFYNDLRRQKQC
ncbi:nucleotide-binding alpha-beta plait domain-containing protein [Tanacetum coccineum]